MSAFEFFFSLYGLVLGLSVVEIVSGFARLAHDRRGVKIGWLTPMLALLMLLDLASFWISAYSRLQNYTLSYAVLVIALLVSALYYLAASVVFPRDFKAEPDLDAVFLRHRRLVISVLIVTGVTAFELLPMLSAEGRAARWAFWTNPAAAFQPLSFIATAVGVMIFKDKRVHVALLALLILPYLITFVTALPQ
jgi:hypothetical protein